MTAEEYLVNEHEALKAALAILGKDYDLLAERCEKLEDDFMFLINLFEFFDSYAHAYVSKVDPKAFNRLKAICGFKEGDEEDG